MSSGAGGGERGERGEGRGGEGRGGEGRRDVKEWRRGEGNETEEVEEGDVRGGDDHGLLRMVVLCDCDGRGKAKVRGIAGLTECAPIMA
eukprot:768649-Hanusia_phi.AAC.6